MVATATLDDVWATIRETDRQIQETNRQMQETDRKFQETDRKFRESDLGLQETERHMKENSDRLDEQIAGVLRAVGELTGKRGKFVEAIVAPACESLFAERGIPVHQVFQRARARIGGRTMEIDVLVVNGEHVVLVEVKTTLRVDDVRDHLERLAEFKTFFPSYADRQVLGAVAGMVIEEGADKFAYRHGLFVLAQSGDTVCLLNDGAFRPKAW